MRDQKKTAARVVPEAAVESSYQTADNANCTNVAPIIKGLSVVRTRPKKVRPWYMRIFPQQAYWAIAELSEREGWAYFKLLIAYVSRDGDLSDDEKELCSITGLKPAAWRELRAKLLNRRFSQVEDGRWIEPDQDVSLEMQRKVSAGGRRGAEVRWGGHHDA